MKKNSHKKIKSPFNDELKKLYMDHDEKDLWDLETDIYTVGGGRDGMIRYFVTIPLTKSFSVKRELMIIAKCIICMEFDHCIEIEDIEMSEKYITLTVLISPEDAPADFVQAFIDQCQHNEIPIAEKYFISNVEKPNEKMIGNFLKKSK